MKNINNNQLEIYKKNLYKIFKYLIYIKYFYYGFLFLNFIL